MIVPTQLGSSPSHGNTGCKRTAACESAHIKPSRSFRRRLRVGDAAGAADLPRAAQQLMPMAVAACYCAAPCSRSASLGGVHGLVQLRSNAGEGLDRIGRLLECGLKPLMVPRRRRADKIRAAPSPDSTARGRLSMTAEGTRRIRLLAARAHGVAVGRWAIAVRPESAPPAAARRPAGQCSPRACALTPRVVGLKPRDRPRRRASSRASGPPSSPADARRSVTRMRSLRESRPSTRGSRPQALPLRSYYCSAKRYHVVNRHG